MNNTKRQNASNDVHQKITDRIIAAIEAGVGQWQMPWSRSGSAGMRPVNAHTGNRAYYRPLSDHIQMPHREFFTGTTTSTASEGYYATPKTA